MAAFNSIRREQAVMPIAILISCIILAFMQSGSHAHEFRVGGTNGWVEPNNTNTENYNQWAGRNRFQVGESLVFVYNSSEDSVLQVTRKDYRSCRTSQPIASFNDGNTVFELHHSGSFFFISGAWGHCQKFQKLHVIVLASRSPHNVTSPVPAPPPAALNLTAPSPTMDIKAAPQTSTTASAATPLQSAGFMCAVLISLCVFIL